MVKQNNCLGWMRLRDIVIRCTTHPNTTANYCYCYYHFRGHYQYRYYPYP